MLIAKISRIFELIHTRGAFIAFLKWRKFSLAAFQIVSRAKLAGVQPKTIVDVGANTGQFSVASANLFDDAAVISIEPDPRVAEQLRKNVGSPCLQNVRVAAIGDHIGTATFNVNQDSQVSSLLPLGQDRIESYPNSVVTEKISVPITTLDHLFEDETLAEPILLKIDVQGFEDRVIAGSTEFLKRIRWVLIEVAFSTLYEGERDFAAIVSLLGKSGFRFMRPLNFHVSPRTGEIIEMDALFEPM